MDSESDDGFTRQPGGEALALDDNDQFDDSEKEQQLSDQEEDHPPLAQPTQPKAQVKGDVVQNEHHDLAVDVNDSEEIDSEEEEDEV